VGVFGSLGLCINVRNTDVNDAVSPAGPEALDQDVATVFRAIVLEEALDSWALWLPGAWSQLRSATGMESWFVANCGGEKCLVGKAAQLGSNLIVP
jgi:hypothetical protein